jgi:hypothetical protein
MELLEDGKELVVRAGLRGANIESIFMSMEADLYQVKTEFSDARRIQEAILHQTSGVLSPLEHGYALANIAFLDVVTGVSADVVSRNLNAGMTLFQSSQYPHGISWCNLFHADLQLREGDAISARAEYIRLFTAAQDNDKELACHCLAKLADPTNPVHANTDFGRWAIVFLAYTLCPQLRSRLMVHQALQRLGDVLAGQGDDTALSILTVALEGFTQMDMHQSKGECMRAMGDVYVQRGDLDRAREMWEAARPLFERSEQRKEVVKIDEKLQTLIAQKLETIPKVQATLQHSGMDSKETTLSLTQPVDRS